MSMMMPSAINETAHIEMGTNSVMEHVNTLEFEALPTNSSEIDASTSDLLEETTGNRTVSSKEFVANATSEFLLPSCSIDKFDDEIKYAIKSQTQKGDDDANNKQTKKSVLREEELTSDTALSLWSEEATSSLKSFSAGNNVTEENRQGKLSMESKQLKKMVSFSNIDVREYDMTLGDHPDCSFGPPVSLDWKYTEMQSIEVETYELNRQPRRSPRQMLMNYYSRQSLLTGPAGHSPEELRQATREVQRAKLRRSVTRTFLPTQRVEEIVASATRKVRRAIKKDEREKKQIESDRLRSMMDCSI